MSKGLDASIGAVNIGTMSTSSIARSGMNAAMIQLDVSAHNIANAQTPGFKPQRAEMAALPEGGVLAVQMPDNMDEPTHVMMREVARLPRFHV